MRSHNFCLIVLVCIMIAGVTDAYCQKQESVKKIDGVESDSTTYDVLISDLGFDTWLLTHRTQATERSVSFYKYEATNAVLKWNSYFNSSRYVSVIDNYIYFNTNEDYGEEVYGKLYWYFRYVDELYGLDLILN